MQRYRFKKIDAFVRGQSTGNPAGCVYLPREDALSAEKMQQIARELAGCVSEVVYVYYRIMAIPACGFFPLNAKLRSAGMEPLLPCMIS